MNNAECKKDYFALVPLRDSGFRIPGSGFRIRFSFFIFHFSLLISLMLWTCGCGDGNAPSDTVPLKRVRTEARTLNDPELRERARLYRDLILETHKALAESNAKVASADPVVLTQDEIDRLKAESARLAKRLAALSERQRLYMVTLVRHGVDVSDLRVEEFGFGMVLPPDVR